MYTIGLVGGVASGKSTVAEMLAELGAVVMNADRTAHSVLNEPEVRDELQARWGPAVVGSDGLVDRSAIARLVFGDDPAAAEQRRYLESVVHPLARAKIEQRRDLLARQGQEVFVIDAPLLLEAGWDTACDCVLYVDTPDARRQKFAKRRGWSDEALASREQAQLPLATKRHRADVVLDNSGELDELRRQVHTFWREVVAPHLGD